jgi:hypothetical protein
MWEILRIFLSHGLSTGRGLWKSIRGRKQLQIWQDLVAAHGLEVVETSTFPRVGLKARTGPLAVWIETSRDDSRSNQITVVIPGPPDFSMVRLLPESQAQGREIEIGDRPFDDTFFIQGPPPLVLALLDAEARRLLLRVHLKSPLELSYGGLRVNLNDEKIPALLPLLLDIGRRFAQPLDIPQRLAENALRDPEAGARLQNLLLLIREHPDAPRTIEVLRAACSDRIPEVRLRAAKALGTEGHGVLLEVAESMVDDVLCADAVLALGQELPFERAQVILDRARGGSRIQTARACLEELGRSGAIEAVRLLARVMALEKGGLAVDAARALGETGNPAAEPWLIPALQREEKDLRVAAASALGRTGSAAAVLPLKEAAERSWLDLDLRRATRQAIAEIQSRLQGASPGQLSLAGAEAGQLSLSTDPAGQLSLSGDGDKTGEA